jgi:hypothetical protein
MKIFFSFFVSINFLLTLTPVWDISWFSKVFLCVNVLPQVLQIKGIDTPRWLKRTWLLRLDLEANARLHKLQLWGLKPPWILRCKFIRETRIILPHSLQGIRAEKEKNFLLRLFLLVRKKEKIDLTRIMTFGFFLQFLLQLFPFLQNCTSHVFTPNKECLFIY